MYLTAASTYDLPTQGNSILFFCVQIINNLVPCKNGSPSLVTQYVCGMTNCRSSGRGTSGLVFAFYRLCLIWSFNVASFRRRERMGSD